MKLKTRAFSTNACCKSAAAAAAAAATPVSATKTTPTRAYPFSNKVTALPLPSTLLPNDNRLLTKARLSHPFVPPPLTSLRRGVGLLPHLHRTLPSPSAHHLLSTFFARRGRGKINPGSVLTLTLSQPPYTFSGVLLSIRRKGPDSSILLRNVVRKTGVEMRVALASPTLKAIKVVQRAGGSTMTSGAPGPPKKKTVSASKALAVVENAKAKSAATVPSNSNGNGSATEAKEWTVGTPGSLPTIRYARSVGLLPKVPRTRKVKDAVEVDEKGTLFSKRTRRARLYFLRDYPGKMSAISAGISKRDN